MGPPLGGGRLYLKALETEPDRHLVCELHPPQKKGTWLQVASIQRAFRVPQVVSLGVHSDSDSQQTLPLASATCPCNSTVSPRQLPGLALVLSTTLVKLSNGSISLSPLYPSPKSDLHVSTSTSFHLGFPKLRPAQA